MRIKGMMIGLLLVGFTACEPALDLSEKPRAVTKDHQTGICTRFYGEVPQRPSAKKDTGMMVRSRAVGQLIKLPPGEDVIVLKRDGEFMKLRFINRPTYPDVWVHEDAVEMRE